VVQLLATRLFLSHAIHVMSHYGMRKLLLWHASWHWVHEAHASTAWLPARDPDMLMLRTVHAWDPARRFTHMGCAAANPDDAVLLVRTRGENVRLAWHWRASNGVPPPRAVRTTNACAPPLHPTPAPRFTAHLVMIPSGAVGQQRWHPVITHPTRASRRQAACSLGKRSTV